jgi:methylmalonyl-CoA epimerase
LELPLDHIAIAVPSIGAVLPILELISGGRGSPVERIESQNVDVVFVGTGDTTTELIQPTTPDSAVARFIEKRGSALHHIAYRVTDIDNVLERLAAAGIRLIDKTGRPGARGHRVAFLHPESTGGVLVELVENREHGK